jgi:hypothetical protein
MSQPSDIVQVCFRVHRSTASLLNELASRHGGMRPLILEWLARAGYAAAAQQELARPDGRRRQPLEARQEAAVAGGGLAAGE